MGNTTTNTLPLVVSFSGGRTSAFMAKYLKDTVTDRPVLFVFANTGKERNETLDFINRCDKEWNLNLTWVEYNCIETKSTFKVVDYDSANRNGEPFEKMIIRYGLPNKMQPHCSRELKLQTITRYLRSVGVKSGQYETAIGIRIDEVHRINWQKAKENKYIYPLATEVRATKEFIREWWDKQCFDLKLKDYEGNCDICWKKSDRKLLTMIIENPSMINWWNEMEIKYGKDEYTFFRSNRSALDLVELSKQRFSKASDSHESSKSQLKFFDHELDIEYDCFCKST